EAAGAGRLGRPEKRPHPPQLGKCAFLFSENTHFDLVKLKKYQVKSLFKKAHFPSCANSQFAVTSFSMGVFGSRSQEGRDLLR
ncbi:hypothetical protein, partial [Adlercreutzia equolifaciens]|uniref:hypothetical protein n=1 Tax=Adlercreutzia equolifaciens TaxID=446660 RepID=UPI001EE045B0